MNREVTKPEIKHWLLALALFLVLTWYVMNPAPGPVRLHKREDHPPDANRHGAQAPSGGASHQIGLKAGLRRMALSSATAEEELPEWPEYLDLD